MNARRIVGGILGTVAGLALGLLIGVGVCLLFFRDFQYQFWMSIALGPLGAVGGALVGGWLGAGRRMGDLTWNLLFSWNLGLLEEKEDRERWKRHQEERHS